MKRTARARCESARLAKRRRIATHAPGFIHGLDGDSRGEIRKHLNYASRLALAHTCHALNKEDAALPRAMTSDEYGLICRLSARVPYTGIHPWHPDELRRDSDDRIYSASINPASALFDQGLWPFRRKFACDICCTIGGEGVLAIELKPHRPGLTSIVWLVFRRTRWYVVEGEEDEKGNYIDTIPYDPPVDWLRRIAGWAPQ